MSFAGDPLITLALSEQPRVRRRTVANSDLPGTAVARHCAISPEESFKRILSLEQKRTERSKKPFLLMLLDVEKLFQMTPREQALQNILQGFANSVRETDIAGWFKENFVVGVIFTEIGVPDASTPDAILMRVVEALRGHLTSEAVDSIDVQMYVFPNEWDKGKAGPRADIELYPDVSEKKKSRKVGLLLKRTIDIAASLIGLLLLSPVFAVVAAIIKFTSEGPVFFRQTRVGQFGKTFTFYKFRTMFVSNDATIHREYMKGFIAGKSTAKVSGNGSTPVYKMANDPRVTRIGRHLRKTSLDEFPQLFNVLKGDMSLVGPRPPVPYECALYDLWHRRRVLEAQPGITGLWQVTGRSRTQFDEMVRLDLRYARSWSLWLDLKILLKTPRAVFSGEGAY